MKLSRRARLLVLFAVPIALMSIVRLWSGEDGLTSSDTIGASLRLSVPILLAGLAGLWAERCGVLNIGIEGMMIFGTWFGGWGAWQFGPWLGLAFAVLGGMLGGLIHAIATVRFNDDQIISGVVLNLLAFFGVRYMSDLAFVGQPGGGVSQSPPQTSAIPRFDVPFISGGELFGWKSPNILLSLEDSGWFFIGDLAGILYGLTNNLSWGTVIGVAAVPATFWILWRTRLGLRLRSSGESPTAAETLGVNVIRLRYVGLLVSGGLAGYAGGILAIVASSYYRQGQTAGRGYIGLATMIFGNWRPIGVLGGASLFGYTEGVKLVANDAISTLFLFVALAAVLLAVMAVVNRTTTRGIVAVFVSVIAAYAYLAIEDVPQSLTQSLPYLATLIVLATASQRLRPPAMAGVPYRRGESH
ncbi:MAG: ABC transporter permease [Ilumatobacteraceae bacterium]|nr:ABC transporter permease [Ilumatobacteraceae bacterium]